MNTTYTIQNLKCVGCANTIISRLEQIEGVSYVLVDTETDSVSLEYSEETILESVKALLDKLGYPVEGEANSIGKKAKSFMSCAIGRISK